MMKLVFFFLIPLSFYCSFYLNMLFYILIFLLFFFNFNIMDYYSSVTYFLGCDYLSYYMILLTLWISVLMIMSSEKLMFFNEFSSFYLVNLVLLIISLVVAFLSMNLFIFYVFFEISLIPTLVLVLGWGYQPERLQAGMYMFFYTLMASLPMIIRFFMFMGTFKLWIFFLLVSWMVGLFFFFFSFLVKMPMFFFHLWLPKAHVEAPVSGSMVLAGIMLKLGGYGIMRVIGFFSLIFTDLLNFLMSLSLYGGVIISLMCFFQVDFKSLIAYSSVSHMGLVLVGLLSMNSLGSKGCLLMMIGHGLCSSGLFCLVNFYYERLGSRSLFIIKGLMSIMPSLSLWWMLLCLGNLSFPFTLNFLGELMLLMSIISYSFIFMIFLSLIIFFSAVYSLYLYSYSQHGKYFMGDYCCSSCSIREFMLMFLHWIPLNFMFLIVNYVVI
uniref:NADH-ubiquinone oxidoreductase chain 4 n=1 Tax=Mastinocerus sp. MAS01 TaxID=1205632 RepID=A0A0S2MP45_9COLE|nr:NADH deshydrogenase subunit 4 [Mastinocerus sp. MAS01]